MACRGCSSTLVNCGVHNAMRRFTLNQQFRRIWTRALTTARIQQNNASRIQEALTDQPVSTEIKSVTDDFTLRAKDGLALWLRDACNCELCVDTSSTQKLFQTTDIPLNVEISNKTLLPDGKLMVSWHNDIPGYDDNHVSTYPMEFLARYDINLSKYKLKNKRRSRVYWDQETISNNIKFIDFNEYMCSDSALYGALEQLSAYGLLFIRGVPDSNTAVEDIGGRIGDLKHTFYGRTWDVKSVPQPENIAYSNKFLGLHMDMLYIARPPSLQLLHCLKNSCEGGTSLFSDSFFAAAQLLKKDSEKFKTLTENRVTFHYKNAGRSYERVRPVIQVSSLNAGGRRIYQVSWSPPFQAPFRLSHGIFDKVCLEKFRNLVEAQKAFASQIEDPNSVYEYRLKEGECVIFENLRVLHARRAFDTSSGERWLKGAYLDNEVWRQRHWELHERLRLTGEFQDKDIQR